MSCCPPTPPSAALGAAFAEAAGPESDLRPTENVECYMQRGGNTTGLHDDATSNLNNKIENSSVPINAATAAVNVQFKLTAGSTRTPTSWSISGTSLPGGVTFSAAGLLSGTFPPASYGQKFDVQVTAVDGLGTIDTRAFTFSPSAGNEGNEIRLISPLPGGIVNSKFGPRLHPIQQVMKPHTGIDMKMADRSVVDVVAAADGEVIQAGGDPTKGYGLRVHVRHVTSTGQHLCTTTYNHLAKIYVKPGQKVMAGQKVGLEGTTGSSTGNHLHFECKLPDGKYIDPEPLINGQLVVADRTLANGDADPTSLSTKNSAASLSVAEVRARSASCAAFGPAYPPADPPETANATPAAPITDPFERAWYFSMTHEVGPHWMTQPQYSPGDAELDAGLHATKQQSYKTGFVGSPNFPGGMTKFGIAQNPNPRINVDTMDYVSAKNRGYNNYWQSSKTPCGDKGARVAVMLFDMNYLHGDGNARQMYVASGINSAVADDDATQQADLLALHAARLEFIRRIPRPEYTRGWLRRAAECLVYCQGL